MRDNDTKPCRVHKNGGPGSEATRGHYEVVPDGPNFGIALQGKVRIHGMELERARVTAHILNEVLDMQRAS